MENTIVEKKENTTEAKCFPPVEIIAEESSEDIKRREHEESEAKRRAEWEAKNRAREEAEQLEWEKAVALDDDSLVAASVKRLGDSTERLTRRNMKLCVTEYVQTRCYEDIAFARQTMHPRKNMFNCFRYINRKAREYIEQEMKDNDEKPIGGVYGGDVPDELCYQWAEEYFTSMNLSEDKDENDKEFEPKPYHGSPSSKSKKKAEKQSAERKNEEIKKTADPKGKDSENQITLFGLSDLAKANDQTSEVLAI